jgi:tRNA threonylcarbamoyladenosine biosynthesis protein TsaE
MKTARSKAGWMIEIETESETETKILGTTLGAVVEPGVVLGLVGPLGAGKTLLARAVAESLGVAPEEIASPTFVLIHEYEGRMPVYHVDVYRLRSPAAFEELGILEYWNRGGICLVEWADRVRELLPEESWWISIDRIDGQRRRFTIEFPPSAQHHRDRLLALLNAPGDASPPVDPIPTTT